MQELKGTSYNIKSYDNVYNKIRLVRKLELQHKIKFLDVGFKETKKDVKFDEKLYKEIVNVFHTKKVIPKTSKTLKQLYLYMLKAITDVKLISSTQLNTKLKRKEYVYTLSEDVIKYHSELLHFRDPDTKEYHNDAVKILNLVVKDVKYWFCK